MRRPTITDGFWKAGALGWLTFLPALAPFSPHTVSWVYALLLLSPLVLMHWVLRITPLKTGQEGGLAWLVLVGAFLLIPSFWLSAGPAAGLLALPWLLVTLLMAVRALRSFFRIRFCLARLCHLAAFLFLPIGAAWALADRLAFQPLGFDPIIVLLTAAHFHYAGFLLPLVTGKALERSGRHHWLGWGVVGGVPLVAAGITLTHLNGAGYLESAAALLTALSVLGVAWLHLAFSFDTNINWRAAWSWRAGGLSLSAGMALAMLYGLRFFFPTWALSIPDMYAWHGTLNVTGMVGLLAGWLFAEGREVRTVPVFQKKLPGVSDR